METSPTFATITKQLALAKAEIMALPLIKDAQGDKAKYLRLGTLLAAVEPVLMNHGILIVQGTGRGIADGFLSAVEVQTTLLHVSGEWLRTSVMIPVAGDRKSAKDGGGFGQAHAQSGGVSITYGRRYSLFVILSLSVDEDSDGAAKNQGRRARATQISESIQVATDDRLSAMRDKLNREKVICACGAKQGEPHKEGCPNAVTTEENAEGTPGRGVATKPAARTPRRGSAAADR